MKSIKLLLVTFTITFVALMTISPAMAKPSIKVQHLQINNVLTAKHHNYHIIKAIGKAPSKLPIRYSNNFSFGLMLSSSTMMSDRSKGIAIAVVNQSNEFFSSAMIVSDKLNQFMSYFSSSAKVKHLPQEEQSPKSNMLKEKCNSSINFN